MFSSFTKIIKDNLQLLSYSYHPSKVYFVLTLIISLTNSMVSIFYLWVQQFAINGLIHNNVKFFVIILVVFSYYMYSLANSLVTSWYSEKYDQKEKLKIREYVNLMMLKKIKRFDISSYENPKFFNKFMFAMTEIDGRVFDVVSNTVNALCSIAFIVIMVMSIGILQPAYLIFALILVINSCILVANTSKTNYEWTVAQTQLNRANEYIVRVFYLQKYAKEMKMFSLYDLFSRSYRKIVDGFIKLQIPFIGRHFRINCITDIVNHIANGAIMFLLIRDVYLQNILAGDFIFVLGGIYYVVQRLSSLVDIFPKFREQSLYMDNINEVLNYEPEIKDNDDGVDLTNILVDDISISNIAFSYDKENGINALNSITMSIMRGEKIAIVGENGSGKTTLVKLLLYLYNPDSGTIKINGNEYKDIKTSSVRQKYSTVFQEFEIFALTIAENIMMRETTEADEQKIWEALEFAGLTEKVKSLPDTIYTPLTREFEENGVFLSGGESQKLAIARAYAKESEILVFDEPSSALDPLAEHELFEKLLMLGKDKTVIYISHRMSTTVNADRIYLLESGNVVETGSHHELLQKRGIYYDMFTVQAEKFNETMS